MWWEENKGKQGSQIKDMKNKEENYLNHKQITSWQQITNVQSYELEAQINTTLIL